MRSRYLDTIKNSFQKCSGWVLNALPSETQAIMNLEAEDTLFVRYNNHRVRQNTQVEQAFMTLQLFSGLKGSKTSLTLTGVEDVDL
ncbi:MAG: Zn-dependent protease, partial [Bdellovibrionales bacterium]|nr:Zn-dependent protease [Bdellovibrionales bacterium]